VQLIKSHGKIAQEAAADRRQFIGEIDDGFLEDLIATDASGQRNGILNVLETATITVWRDGEPAVSETIAVTYGPNPVRIIYDTSDLVVEDSLPSKSRAPSTRLAQGLDEPVWGLGDPYPNPSTDPTGSGFAAPAIRACESSSSFVSVLT